MMMSFLEISVKNGNFTELIPGKAFKVSVFLLTTGNYLSIRPRRVLEKGSKTNRLSFRLTNEIKELHKQHQLWIHFRISYSMLEIFHRTMQYLRALSVILNNFGYSKQLIGYDLKG